MKFLPRHLREVDRQRPAQSAGACSRLGADSSLHACESDGTPMKLLCCRACRVEMEPIALADGSAVLVCVDCELIALQHEATARAAHQAWQPAPRSSRDSARSA